MMGIRKRTPPTVYLDNAATTFPKPRRVIAETERILRYACGNPGRSSHCLSMRAAETVYECRRKVAELFGGEDERVIFTSSATHSLNLGIKTALRKGDHVLISDIEHNSVIRPISALAERGLITYDVYEADADPARVLSEISAKTRSNTAMVIACHRSNICNLLQPIGAIGEYCRGRGITFLVDASQSAGCVDIHMKRDGIDILCAPGHKGLYGIPGSGVALFGDRFFDGGVCTLSTFMEGGNGIRSRDGAMPDFLPERLEAGTLAVPAIGALSAGIDFINGIGIPEIDRYEKRIFRRAMRGTSVFGDSLRTYGDGAEGGVLLFSVEGIGAEEMAAELDGYGICVRAGLHCAPTAHAKLGTPDDGAIRVSFGVFNTTRDVDRLWEVTEHILRKRKNR